MLKIYGFFHLNLMFSSLEENQQEVVINRCYHPLLDLIEKHKINIGLEISGLSIRRLEKLDYGFIRRFNSLIANNLITLIGSGYSQIIGPLVPSEINQSNLRLGNEVYQDVLGFTPKIFLINEQAFSSSLVGHYCEIGAKAIIMEWNNPSKEKRDWKKNWQFFPQFVKGTNGYRLPVIWNNSKNFQQFQRYAHSDIELDEYWKFIKSHSNAEEQFFPFYGNDAEVFDYRTKRFKTEAKLKEISEWERLSLFFSRVINSPDFEIVPLSDVIRCTNNINCYNELEFTSAKSPVAVKKQPKYNITRWGVTGRNDFDINTRCWRLFEKLNQDRNISDDKLRDLCYLWSSDFRTHITSRRWKKYLRKLSKLEDEHKASKLVTEKPKRRAKSGGSSIDYEGNLLVYRNTNLEIGFNCNKGLSVEYFKDKRFGDNSLFGTLKHGYFDDIAWTFDLFSGHLVYDTISHGKFTDLEKVIPKVSKDKTITELKCKFNLGDETCTKKIFIDELRSELTFFYKLTLPGKYIGSLRLGYVNIHTEAFNVNELEYETHNGGPTIEIFKLNGETFEHGRAVSKIVSAESALGMTGGIFRLGDQNKKVEISFKNYENAFLGLVQKEKIDEKHFYRFCLTATETDETSKIHQPECKDFSYSIRVLGE